LQKDEKGEGQDRPLAQDLNQVLPKEINIFSPQNHPDPKQGPVLNHEPKDQT
jgi:hypothetical protein